MALDEPTTQEGSHGEQELQSPAKRDDAPDYYKRPKFKRNIIPFETDDLSVRVIRERFLVPDQVKENSAAAKAGLKLGDEIVKINGADASAMRLATAESVIKQAGEQLQLVVANSEQQVVPHPPEYYKWPHQKHNVMPFEVEDLSVQVIRDRFLIPEQISWHSPKVAKTGPIQDLLEFNDQEAALMMSESAGPMGPVSSGEAPPPSGPEAIKDDEEAPKDPEKPKETREITFAGNENKEDLVTNPSAPKHKPDEGRENWIQPPERKVWHPIVWQQPPPPIPPEQVGKEKRHMQLITNIRRLLSETSAKPDEFNKHIERMMLALPSGSRPVTVDEDDWDAEPIPEPEPPKPKTKKKKTKKVKKVIRKRTESETSEDSVSQDVSAAVESEPIPEEE
ncbi:uncharacterized protein LOC129739792 isoform X3 [Uranotaenia lowii]|uniref:uncharacterized protein LOC129739792 isoform X3 n=1 Tax=Uranotaenia lowii TaxID=190385 RepID=UPI00247994F0|nr:uncharacterized protein LOC129739792 isoform X3 [Uranotaenia lowii]